MLLLIEISDGPTLILSVKVERKRLLVFLPIIFRVGMFLFYAPLNPVALSSNPTVQTFSVAPMLEVVCRSATCLMLLPV